MLSAWCYFNNYQQIAGINKMPISADWICPVCSLTHQAEPLYQFRYDAIEMIVFQCRCGLRYTNFVSEPIPELYGDNYYEHVRYSDAKGKKKYIDHLWSFFSTNVIFGDNPHQERKLLDVGCATGDFVENALQMKWDAQGIDISEAAVGIAKNRQLPVRNMSLAEIVDSGQKFDAVTGWDVLEHVQEPSKMLIYCFI